MTLPDSAPQPSPMPQKVDDVYMVFPAGVSKLLPPWDSIPEPFRRGQRSVRPWLDLFSEWFYRGIKSNVLVPKPGIDKQAALRHLKVCMGSFEPKHEHKEAGVAYLLSLWFEEPK